MSIGKVDCTVETSLCKKYNVKGYPTLKYIRNGNAGPAAARDYTSGRDADSIIEFANKMTRPAVSLITTSYDDAIDALYYGGKSNTNVAYIIYDPNMNDPTSLFVHKLIDNSGASTEEKERMKIIKATERTREYEHVADKLMDRASFGLLHPMLMSRDEIRKFFTSHATTATTTTTTTNNDDDGHVDGQFFLARIERNMPPILYTGDPKSSTDIETFVTSTNLPTVLEVSPQNFNFISRRGKPLIVGVYDPTTTSSSTNNDDDGNNDDRVKVQTELRHYAIHGRYKDEYLYAIIDGGRWDKFLTQFYVHKAYKSGNGGGGTVITQYIAIDRQKGFYWHDKSVATVSDFISGIKNGTIHIRAMKKPSKYETPALWKTFMNYMPYSLVGVFVLFGIVFYLAVVLDRKFIANEFTNSSTNTTTNGKGGGGGGGGGGLESTKEYQQMMKEEAAVETKKDQ